MQGTLLATISMIVLIGLISFLGNVKPDSKFIDTTDGVFIYKILALTLLFLASFFCFTQSIRLVNHVSMLITAISLTQDDSLKALEINPLLSVKNVALLTNRAGLWNTIGV